MCLKIQVGVQKCTINVCFHNFLQLIFRQRGLCPLRPPLKNPYVIVIVKDIEAIDTLFHFTS